MKEEAAKYSFKNITVIPFGIDLNIFFPLNKTKEDQITIGCFKSLKPIYGIDRLINVFHSLLEKFNDKKLHLLIAGEGQQRQELEQLVSKLNIKSDVTFLGNITPSDIPKYMQKIDIAALLSKSESFGVAAIEASACEKPVVATDIGGLPEVVKHEITGLLVPLDNHTATVDAFSSLIADEDMRKKLGKNGRIFVEEKYNWKQNVESMISYYQTINQ